MRNGPEAGRQEAMEDANKEGTILCLVPQLLASIELRVIASSVTQITDSLL